MKDIKDKLINKCLVGALVGMMIPLIIYLFNGYDMEMLTNRPLFVAQFIGSAALGTIAVGGTVVYEIESWGLRRASFAHYLVTLASFIFANLVLGWFDSAKYLLFSLGSFTVVYLAIWAVVCIASAAEIKKMNRYLQQMGEDEEN